MTTGGVAAATGYSVQQVRELEASGVITAALRTRSGYRQFADSHVRDLRAYRDLALAVGPVDARQAMREIRSMSRGRAAEVIGRFHERLMVERERALSARAGLAAIETEAATEAEPVDTDSMTITELASALGVAASTLRFWETCGLVVPDRVLTPAGTARRYPLDAVREARITAALRAGGYRVPDVARAISAIRELGDVSDSTAALDARVEHIANRAVALLRAGATLAEIIESNS